MLVVKDIKFYILMMCNDIKFVNYLQNYYKTKSCRWHAIYYRGVHDIPKQAMPTLAIYHL